MFIFIYFFQIWQNILAVITWNYIHTSLKRMLNLQNNFGLQCGQAQCTATPKVFSIK